MTHEDFQALLKNRLAETRSVLDYKNREYSRNGDKLYNFKAAANMLNQTPEKALLGMLIKHLVSIFDMVNDLDEEIIAHWNTWSEKIGDAINYLILLEALVAERTKEGACENAENQEYRPGEGSNAVVLH